MVLIVADTLRADRLPFYGCSRNTAPFLDELAQKSLVFENAWSPSSWTLPAMVSVLTSVHPFQHGVNSLVGLELEPGDEPVPVNAIPEEVEPLAEELKTAGYATYGVVSNILVGEEVGFDRGFDRFVRLADEDAEVVNEQVADWKQEILGAQPFFLYLHYLDPHAPFHAREPWFELAGSASDKGWPEFTVGPDAEDDLDWIMTRLEPGPEELEGKKAQDLSAAEVDYLLAWIHAAYDSEIGFLDSRIRDVFEMLALDDAVVIFLADHGEEFYEHGDLTHGQSLYGESVRVPLVVALPGEGSPRGRIREHVSTLDLVPTMRAILQLPPSKQDRGRDLLAGGERGAVIGHLGGKSGQHPLENDLRSIVVGNHRLIATEDGRAELYDLAQDPYERRDLAEDLPEVASELLARLVETENSSRRFPPAFRLPDEESREEMIEHLRALGYVN